MSLLAGHKSVFATVIDKSLLWDRDKREIKVALMQGRDNF